MKVLTVFGTRPEAIKMVPVIREMASRREISSVVCVTAQHREMLDQVLNNFNIRIDYDLNLMKNKQSLFDLTSRGLDGIKAVLAKERPDIVLVQGDTTTAFIAALAAFYMRVPIGHVEAGLRSYDKYQPFPEEINRRMISCLADMHFAPTWSAQKNLLAEGIPEQKIYVTGNTVIDALLQTAKMQTSVKQKKKWEIYFRNLGIDVNKKKLILVTGHRRESFGQGFQNICRALRDIAKRNLDVQVIYPVHMNPNVQTPVREWLGEVENIHLIDPVSYDALVYLLTRASLVLTDSGGIQEEAPSFGTPVLVMREVTERREAIEMGFAKIVGTNVKRIVAETERLLHDEVPSLRGIMPNPYGDGKAAKRIVSILHKQQRIFIPSKETLDCRHG